MGKNHIITEDTYEIVRIEQGREEMVVSSFSLARAAEMLLAFSKEDPTERYMLRDGKGLEIPVLPVVHL